MELFVSYQLPEHEEVAFHLAKEFGLTCLFQGDIDKKENNQSYFFMYKPDHSSIRRGYGNLSKDIYCNFSDWLVNFKDPLLSRCLKGLPEKFSVLDATAGFGKDALEISKNKQCESILLVEREKWLFYLLQEGVANAENPDVLNKFSIKNADSREHLSNTKSNYDLIYIDPMFPGVGKSKAKRSIQALRDLTKEIETNGLLDLAIKKATKRVVVKRHKNSIYLEGLKPNYSVKGKVVRYDVYNSS